MTNDQLNQLFDSARKIPVETSAEQIASWVGVAATSTTGILGIAGKLKLFIAKKAFIMVGTSLSIISAGVITAVVLNTTEPVKENVPSVAHEVVTAPVVVTEESVVVEETTVAAPKKTIAETSEREVMPPRPLEPLQSNEPILQAMQVEYKIPAAPKEYEFVNVEPLDNGKKIKASGNVIKKEFEVKAFSELEIAGVFDIVILQGDAAKVVVEADDNLMELFQIENKGNRLIVDMTGTFEDKKTNTVYITITELEKLSYSGVGDLSTTGSITLKALDCDIAGVGDLQLEVNCTDLHVNFTGVGDVMLSGTGNKATYELSGVGDLEADELKTKVVSLTLSGVGDAKVNASDEIKVNLTGLGDVKYSGSPEKKDLSNAGMGKIKGS